MIGSPRRTDSRPQNIAGRKGHLVTVEASIRNQACDWILNGRYLDEANLPPRGAGIERSCAGGKIAFRLR